MNCPLCQVELILSERQGIEVDYCPRCRGVWLDRGELDKIVERSAYPAPQGHASEQWNGQHQPSPSPHHSGYPGQYPRHSPHGHHKRKSFLEEIFDFD